MGLNVDPAAQQSLAAAGVDLTNVQPRRPEAETRQPRLPEPDLPYEERIMPGLTYFRLKDDEKTDEEVAEAVDRDLWRQAHRQLTNGYRVTLARELALQRARREAQRIIDAEERPPVELPEALTLAERLERPTPEVTWRVAGWLPAGGRAVLAAPAKAGKTGVAINLTRCLVDGSPWLVRDPVTRIEGKVAVLDFEMSEHQLDRWYAAADIGNTDQVLVLPMRGKGAAFDLRDEELRGRWAKLLTEHNVDFVVWDCLRPVIDALGLDENHEASALLTSFDALLAAAGRPEALVIHHMGHNSERARGDSGILGWGDANWKLLLSDGDEHGARFISAFGREVDQPEAQLAREALTGRLRIAGGSRAEAGRSAAADAVVAALEASEAPLATTQAVTGAMDRGISRDAARDALSRLVAMGEVLTEPGDRTTILHRLNSEAASPREAAAPPAACTDPAGGGRVYAAWSDSPTEGEKNKEDPQPGSSPDEEGELRGRSLHRDPPTPTDTITDERPTP